MEDFFSNDLERFNVKLEHTGRVRWWTIGVSQTSCHVDGTHFPFDWQECSIVIKTWAFDRRLVDVRNASDHVRLDGFQNDRKKKNQLRQRWRSSATVGPWTCDQ